MPQMKSYKTDMNKKDIGGQHRSELLNLYSNIRTMLDAEKDGTIKKPKRYKDHFVFKVNKKK